MRLKDVKVDVEKVEDGAWVDNIPELEGLRLKVRGANNKDWRKLQARLIQSLSRAKRIAGQIDPDVFDRINSRLLLETCLLDWSGLDGDDGKPLPYSKEMAKTLLTDPQYGRFRDGVLWAANVVGDQLETEVQVVSKN
jgi:hypothetical protein